MIRPKRPATEPDRLRALYEYDILDSAAEAEFDMLVELAARICETPISTITLIDEDRQWFKAKLGVEALETGRDVSFCGHAILQNDLMVVNDTHKDPRFCDNPYVTGDPAVRFYAGAQIHSSTGHKLGTLCVTDSQPRDLGWHQASALRILAHQASRLLELRYLKKKGPMLWPNKEALVRQEIVGQLSARQAAYFAATEEQLLEPLKTGRFTKKELTAIYQLSKLLLQANRRFAAIGALYNKKWSMDDTTAGNTILFKNWLTECHRLLQEKTGRKLPGVQLSLLPADLALDPNGFRSQVLQQLFEIIALDFSSPLKIQGLQQDRHLEIKCLLPHLHMDGYATPEEWAEADGSPLEKMGAYNLQLLQQVLTENHCRLAVAADPGGGSYLSVTMPPRL